VKTTPEQFLLWFHHLPWSFKVSSGRTLWDEMVVRYSRGVESVAKMQATWEGLAQYVDPERFAQVKAYLAIQRDEAQWWRDACIAYFQSVNHLPLPAGYAPPKHPLGYYQALKFPYAPGRT
jgi:alpha-glucuronidase